MSGCRVVLAGLLLAGATGAAGPFGPTTTQQAVDRINSSSMRGVPPVPAPAPPRGGMVWVPDRYVPTPGAPQGVFVPGHWETILPEGGKLAPPEPAVVLPPQNP